MSDAGWTAELRPGDWTQAILRLLLFIALFTVFLLAGAVLIRPGSSTSARDLLMQSAMLLIAAAAAGVLLLRRLDRRPAGALGFGLTRAAPAEIGSGLLIGLAAIGIPVALLAAFGSVRFVAEGGTAGAWIGAVSRDLAVLGVAAAAEEALFRGYPLQVLVRGVGTVPAVLATSVAFALAHGANPNVDVIGLVNIFLAGIVLAVAYLRTRSLWFATAVHLGWNWGMASVLDLPVSGLEMIDTPFYEPVVAGADWLSGGAFGPEGGIAGTLGFGVALLALFALGSVRERDETRALRPLIDTLEA
jgi:membrane protease YdiL (CAAX protease family)